MSLQVTRSTETYQNTPGGIGQETHQVLEIGIKPTFLSTEDFFDNSPNKIDPFDSLSIEQQQEIQKDEKELLETVWPAITANTDPDFYGETMDPIKLYLIEASRAPLLNHEQEVELAKRIEKKDKEAKDTMTVSNLRLVISKAKGYHVNGMDFLDHIQNGNIGLIKAVERYDWRKGFKFSTYATWWIRQAITRGIADNRNVIRIPVHMSDDTSKYDRWYRALNTQYHREPTPEELSQATGFVLAKIESIEIAKKVQPISIYTPIGEEGDEFLGELVDDPNQESVEDLVIAKLRREKIRKALDTLPPRDRKVIERRFGIRGDEPQRPAEISDILMISTQTIRRVEIKALDSLSKNPDVQSLRETGTE